MSASTFRPYVEELDGRCLPSFSPAVNYGVDNPFAVVTADFNGDTRLDPRGR